MIYSERKDVTQTKHILKINKNHSLEWVEQYKGNCLNQGQLQSQREGKKFYRKLETMLRKNSNVKIMSACVCACV